MAPTKLEPPVSPMLAKAVAEVPVGTGKNGYLYEPKWDGFRCLLFIGDRYVHPSCSAGGAGYNPSIACGTMTYIP